MHDGKVSLAQAEAIVSGLRKLPARLTRSELTRCQESILDHAGTLGPSELRTLAARLLEVIDPEQAETEEAKRLAAEERAARRDRFLRLSPDFHGSMRITGQLPVAPTVHITMDYDTLVTGLGRVGMLANDELDGISAGEARRMACDAGIVPMVLDGGSRPLDVGREKRLFTPAMIAAFAARDKGCAFPNCHVPPASCHAHHIVPWWNDGPTSLTNGVLLCPHHHRQVEPDPNQSAESQWQVHLDAVTGLPWFTPPTYVDPRRRPRQNARFVLQQITLNPSVEAPPCPPDTRELILEDFLKYPSPAWAGSG